MDDHRPSPPAGERGGASVDRPTTDGQRGEVGRESLPLQRAEFAQHGPVRGTVLDHSGPGEEVQEASRGRRLGAVVGRGIDDIRALSAAVKNLEPLCETVVKVADDECPHRVDTDL
jgi:hypothetical protein